jgi:hypothetical protein
MIEKDYQLIDLQKKVKQIINKNNPKKSIILISKLHIPGLNTLVGIDKALRLYKLHCDESVEYDSKKHKNNINAYETKVNSNITEANKYVKNIKSK